MPLLIRPCKAELRGFMAYDEVSQNLIFRLSYWSWIRMMIEPKTFAYPVNVYILISVVRHIMAFHFHLTAGINLHNTNNFLQLELRARSIFSLFLGDPP